MDQGSHGRQIGKEDRLGMVAGPPQPSPERVRILIVDGSPLMRRLLTRILQTDERLEVVGAARHAAEVSARFDHYRPDVVVLDGPLRTSDEAGASSLEELSNQVQTVVREALDERCARLTLEAFDNAAQAAPREFGPGSAAAEHFAENLLKQVWRARRLDARPRATPRQGVPAEAGSGKTARAGGPKPKPRSYVPNTASQPQVLVIGSSTGGPAALGGFLSALPPDFPLPILIVQHMPPHFTRLLADRLTKTCCISFVEAEDGMEVLPGRGYIAPGDFHMGVSRRGRQHLIQLSQGAAENSCRPAVDYLFRSVAEAYVSASIAVVLTGMGQDGLRGVRALKSNGVSVLVQDRETSVVWGMPGAVAEAGLADHVLPIPEIVSKILGLL